MNTSGVGVRRQTDRAEDRFLVALESAQNAFVIVNLEGRVILANARTEDLFGYTREELLGQPVEILVPASSQISDGDRRREITRRPRGQLIGAGSDLFGRRKDGSLFPVEIGLNPIKMPQGACVLTSIVDITDCKRPQEETLFKQKLESLGASASELGHDLNNLLGCIGMEADLFLYSKSPDRGRDHENQGTRHSRQRSREAVYGTR